LPTPHHEAHQQNAATAAAGSGGGDIIISAGPFFIFVPFRLLRSLSVPSI
jgi:hypothetical protein